MAWNEKREVNEKHSHTTHIQYTVQLTSNKLLEKDVAKRKPQNKCPDATLCVIKLWLLITVTNGN